MISDEMQNFMQKYNIPFTSQERLTQTCLPKTRYVTHIRNLSFYMKRGLIVTAIHKGVIFKQSAWMREYIELNTAKRINSRSKFEKDFFKLLVGILL